MITIQNEIHIKCSPEALFSYVTQPWHWHDWHPSSVSASADKTILALGDHFMEEIIVHPFSPFPLTLRRQTRYEVTAHQPPSTWEVKGILNDGWLKIHYDFIPIDEGTLFKRRLTFEITGFKKIFLPYLLKRRMEELSILAMQNLKKRMESEK